MSLRRMEIVVESWDGKKVKKLRTQFGESQSQFCHRLGVTVDALQFWEQGRGTGPSKPIEIILQSLQDEIRAGRIPPVPVFPPSKSKPSRKRELAGAK